MGFTEDTICARRSVPDHFPQELSILEKDLDEKRALKAIAYFKTTLPEMVQGASRAAEILANDRFLIGHPNAVMALEGYLLKTAYQRAALAYELARCRAPAAALPEKRRRVEAARKAFCDFIASHGYTD